MRTRTVVIAGILAVASVYWSLSDAAVPRLTPQQIDNAFPQVILANLSGPDARIRWARLTPYEKYRLKALFAYRNDGNAGPLLGAAMRALPAPEFALLVSARASDAPVGKVAPVMRGLNLPNLDFTLEEIYLEFRTGAGNLTILTSMTYTAQYAAVNLSLAYQAGSTVGSLVAQALENYSPETLDAIGGTIDAGISNVLGSPAQDVPMVIQVDPFQALAGMGGGSGKYKNGAMDEDGEEDGNSK